MTGAVPGCANSLVLTAVLSWTALVVAMLAAAPLGYLLLLTLLSFPKRPPTGALLEAPAARSLSLVAVIPAHNEANGIAATVASLLAAEYPAGQRRVLVIADNCDDDTAARARAAGAEVLERKDELLRGKGYALGVAFDHVLADATVEGALVIDADTLVASNLWRAMSQRLSAGQGAVQAANRVRNRDVNWRTRLLAIALAMINGVRCLGREQLSLSVGLKGNGMAFSREVLLAHPHRAVGLVEDVEQAVALGLGGVRVAYAAETWIASESPVTAQSAVSQRRRWEGGRAHLIRTLLPRVLRAAIAQRSLVLADLALELLIPPLSYPAALLCLGSILEGSHYLLAGTFSFAIWLWFFGACALLAHVLRGLLLSGTGWRGLQALLLAPGYVAWKLVVARPWARQGNTWVRTTRVSEEPEPQPVRID